MVSSPLTNGYIPHHNKYNKRLFKIAGFTIHHQVSTNDGGINHGKNPTSQASAHYWINDGKLYSQVGEEFRAWTTGGTTAGWESDHRNITVEVQNSSLAPSYAVSDANLKLLIRLIADVFKRYNLGKVVRGKLSGLAIHQDYVNTACPGPYLTSKLDYIIAEANKINSTSSSTPKPSGNSYTVISGDSLSLIGTKTGILWTDIAKWNNIKSPYIIRVGQKLSLKSPIASAGNTHIVVRGETLSGIAAKYKLDWKNLANINSIVSPYTIVPGQKIRLTGTPQFKTIFLPVGWKFYKSANHAKTMNTSAGVGVHSGAFQILRMHGDVPELGKNGKSTGYVHPSVLQQGYKVA